MRAIVTNSEGIPYGHVVGDGVTDIAGYVDGNRIRVPKVGAGLKVYKKVAG